MHPLKPKQTILTLKKKKKLGEKIAVVTAYDYPTARVAAEAGMDIILVGDSLGMVVQGQPNTLKVTMNDMLYHTRLVAAAKPHSLIVADMPYGSFHLDAKQAVRNALRFVKEGGAEAVKLEGGQKRYAVIEAILNSEIPVMGHLGLTPQSIHVLGGFKAQGKQKTSAAEMVQQAKALEKLGVFAIVLESIPLELAAEITASISIPTIGIGAGQYCDGQVLVFHDLVGFTRSYLPKFVRQYADIYTSIHQALTHYVNDVRQGNFPGMAESFGLKEKQQKDITNEAD